jgi:Family of unknown function (DUF5362)
MTNPYAPPLANVADRAPGGGSITEEMISALRGTKGWVLLIGILMFIAAIFMGLGGVFMMFGSAMMGAAGMKDGAPAGMFIGIGAVYLLMTVIYVFMGIYLVKYSSAISRLIASGQSADMEAALEQQRKFWRLAGVLALIAIVFMVVGMLAAIAIPVLLGAGMGK